MKKVSFMNRIFSNNCMDAAIYKYMKIYLKCSRYKKNSFVYRILKIRLNRIGFKLGFEIEPGILDDSTIIYHQNIVVNSYAVIGKNVKFHGNNCIGNNGKDLGAPKIGNNVDIGFGAVIIGDVLIADDCIIGANTIVTKSFLEPGTVIVGNPGRSI